MSKEQTTIELIESYLENTMSPEARESFENLLQQDPVVRSEFEVQQQLVNSIKEFRRAELKAQLNNVTVGVGPAALLSLKTAAIITITAIVGLGTFLYLQKEDTSITKIDLEPEQNATTEQVPAKPEATPLATDQVATIDIVGTPDASDQQPNEKSESFSKIAAPTKKPVPQPEQDLANQPAVVSIPTVLQPNKDEDDLSIEELVLPSEQLSQTNSKEQGTLAVENTDNGEYNFHYQFYQDKLFLYGDFKDTPYEILELNFSNGKKLFMFYRGAYYSLKENQIEITSLEALTDNEIIKKLEIIKANK
ncbi:MAG: hypothetical protein ACR2MX_02890 [Cyclobacteriaceae bacterium]